MVTMFFVIMIQSARIKDLKENLRYEKAKNQRRPSSPPRIPGVARSTGNTTDAAVPGTTVSSVSPYSPELPVGFVWAMVPHAAINSK